MRKTGGIELIPQRRRACLAHCLTPAGPLGPRAGRPAASRRARAPFLCGSLRRSLRGTPRALPSRSQTPIDAPVWRASPAGPRQGIDWGFPSPSHPRRKAGRHGRAMPASRGGGGAALLSSICFRAQRWCEKSALGMPCIADRLTRSDHISRQD